MAQVIYSNEILKKLKEIGLDPIHFVGLSLDEIIDDIYKAYNIWIYVKPYVVNDNIMFEYKAVEVKKYGTYEIISHGGFDDPVSAKSACIDALLDIIKDSNTIKKNNNF